MPVTLTCATCGERFVTEPFWADRGSRFCSHKCRNADPDFRARLREARGNAKLPADDTVARLYTDGASMKEIAAQFGCNPEAVRVHLIRRGIPRRGKGAVSVTVMERRQARVTNATLISDYQGGKSLKEMARDYRISAGAIRDRLRAEGVTLRRSVFGSGSPFRCVDGHLVRSRYEQLVDDWLWDHRMAHAYEPPLPFGEGQHADFLVGETYVEIWGVSGSATYTERRRRKMRAYADYNLALISLYPRQVEEELDRWLSPLCQR